ncbi:hypothetical protein [Hymenobacter guriensis]|uniref:Uncharacterized protein n=1 Tax=Hymenobacter guriensis TaxID=2793065 RepID=A0ABS0L7Q6_9BACT|nr:hypothetical protein [Hymenobacter guriensis]MBG8556160.1 hypothetical protein [Hymenobacter guriensis]
MIHALAVSLLASLLLASLVRAARPGNLLHSTVGAAWEWWLVYRPVWLPAKASGDCAFCTCFWVPGLPVAALAALCTPAGGWAVCVPLLVAFLCEHFTSR